MVCKVNRNGGRKWWKNDVLHREDGPAVVHVNQVAWIRRGKLHREDGPAYMNSKGIKIWFQNGLRHREDGPAVEYPNGKKDYWIDGNIYTKKEWKKYYGV